MFLRQLALGVLSLALSIGFCGMPGPEGSSSDEPAEQGVAAEPAAPAAAGIEVESVEFARQIGEQFQLVGGPVTSFHPDEPISARIRIDGRPRSGTVTMRWMWRDLQLGEVSVDLGDANGGLLFSFGEDTMIRVTFTPRDVSYIGDSQRIVVLHEGREVGSYPIRIVPPEGAIATRFQSAALYRRFDPSRGPSEPATTFAPDDTVYLAGRATMGLMSWVDVVWTVDGEPAPALSRTIVARENRDPMPFYFEGAPPGGAWPPGAHQVVLRVDDVDVGTYPFTVSSP